MHENLGKYELTANGKKWFFDKLPTHGEMQAAWVLLKKAMDRREAGGPAEFFGEDLGGFTALVDSTVAKCLDGKTPGDMCMTPDDIYQAFMVILEYRLVGRNADPNRSIRPTSSQRPFESFG